MCSLVNWIDKFHHQLLLKACVSIPRMLIPRSFPCSKFHGHLITCDEFSCYRFFTRRLKLDLGNTSHLINNRTE